MDLAGKVALVTGGARRLGRAAALALAERGVRVAVHYRRSAEAAAETLAEVRRLGVAAAIMQADLADEAAVRTLIPAAREEFGTVDILINNAALFEPGGFAETTAEQWDRHFAVNLKAPFLLSQAFAAQVPSDRTGKIVNLGDWRGLRPGTDHFAYTVTKAALQALTRSLGLALAPNIHVNYLALGAILRPEGAHGDPKALAGPIPLGRTGGVADVTGALLFLLESDFITGETLVIDGGRSLV